MKWRRSIKVLIAVGVICGVVSIILQQKGYFRYVNRNDLIKSGPEGEELWGWVEEDRRGPYTGWVKESPKYERHAKYFVKAGKRHGKYEGWYESGQKRDERRYKAENYLESAIVWQPNGTRCPLTNVVKGTGTLVAYRENGPKDREVTYKDGKEDGPYTEWHDNGQKRGEGTYKDGKKDGPYTSWHDNGQKRAESTYKDGKLEGLFTSWHDNGQKWVESTYKDGKTDGPYTEWFENGKVFFQETYKGGRAAR